MLKRLNPTDINILSFTWPVIFFGFSVQFNHSVLHNSLLQKNLSNLKSIGCYRKKEINRGWSWMLHLIEKKGLCGMLFVLRCKRRPQKRKSTQWCFMVAENGWSGLLFWLVLPIFSMFRLCLEVASMVESNHLVPNR